MAEPSLRPRRSDDLGLKRALSDRLLPLLVAAMVFLAALALAASIAASGMARHLQWGAGATLTVQVPQPLRPPAQSSATDARTVSRPNPSGRTRADAVAAILAAAPEAKARQLSSDEIAALLQPWLGDEAAHLAIDMPAVFEVRLLPPASNATQLDALAKRLEEVAPNTLVERNSAWFDRLSVLAGSLQACAAIGLLVVTFVAAAVVAVATRAGLTARRDAIEIVHGLGATDAMIAGRFAARVTLLAFSGAVLGVVLAVPMLLELAAVAAPFQGVQAAADERAAAMLSRLPALLWELLPTLPLAAALIGWVTAQLTVRSWLGALA